VVWARFAKSNYLADAPYTRCTLHTKITDRGPGDHLNPMRTKSVTRITLYMLKRAK